MEDERRKSQGKEVVETPKRKRRVDETQEQNGGEKEEKEQKKEKEKEGEEQEEEEEEEDEEKEDSPDPDDPLIQIQSSWKFVYIVQFFRIFRHNLNIPKVSIEVLERDFLSSTNFTVELFMAILKYSGYKMNSTNWEEIVRKILKSNGNEELFSIEQTWREVEIPQKIEILYIICEWVFEHYYESLRQGLDDVNDYKTLPLGKDSKGRTYWYFQGTRLYREVPSKKNFEPEKWELICQTAEEWRQIEKSFESSRQKIEQQLYISLQELAPKIASKLENKEKQLQKQAFFESLPRKASSRLQTKRDMEEKAKQEEELRYSLQQIRLMKKREEEERIQEEKRQQEEQIKLKRLQKQREEKETMAKIEKKFGKEYSEWKKEIKQIQLESPKKFKPEKIKSDLFHEEFAFFFEMMGPKRKGTEVRHSLIPMTFPMKAACKNILDLLKKDEHAKPFLHPVDPDELNLPDYFIIVKNPTDLSTIYKKLLLDEYHSVEEVKQEIQLMFSNCFLYNLSTSDIVKQAKIFEARFHKLFKKMKFLTLLKDQEFHQYLERLAQLPNQLSTSDPYLSPENSQSLQSSPFSSPFSPTAQGLKTPKTPKSEKTPKIRLTFQEPTQSLQSTERSGGSDIVPRKRGRPSNDSIRNYQELSPMDVSEDGFDGNLGLYRAQKKSSSLITSPISPFSKVNHTSPTTNQSPSLTPSKDSRTQSQNTTPIHSPSNLLTKKSGPPYVVSIPNSGVKIKFPKVTSPHFLNTQSKKNSNSPPSINSSPISNLNSTLSPKPLNSPYLTQLNTSPISNLSSTFSNVNSQNSIYLQPLPTLTPSSNSNSNSNPNSNININSHNLNLISKLNTTNSPVPFHNIKINIVPQLNSRPPPNPNFNPQLFAPNFNYYPALHSNPIPIPNFTSNLSDIQHSSKKLKTNHDYLNGQDRSPAPNIITNSVSQILSSTEQSSSSSRLHNVEPNNFLLTQPPNIQPNVTSSTHNPNEYLPSDSSMYWQESDPTKLWLDNHVNSFSEEDPIGESQTHSPNNFYINN